jgi:hypothetical protein
MLLTNTETTIQCGMCMKADVCKYKQDYLKLAEQLVTNSNCNNDIFSIQLQCAKYVGVAITMSESYHPSIIPC